MRAWLAGLALLVSVSATPAAAEDVAITFDDLPTLSLSTSTVYAEVTTRELLGGLRRQHVPATGFVNEGKLEGPDRSRRIALLSDWLDAGMDLGNHSYSHLSLTSTPVEAYIDDVAKGEQVTRALLAARGRAPHWYRHPYLETGPTLQARRRFEGWLSDHGYRVAPVTMENSDWLFALPYDNAVLEGDWPGAQAIQQAYLDFTAQIVPWYREAALGVLGRRPAFVFLLHASRLNADSMDRLAGILRSDGLNPVSLDQAMTDPAYAIADDYAGPDGNQWITRWAATLRKDMPWRSLPAPSAEIAAQDARLEDMPGEPAPVKAGQ
jgi:peptidoglycan-N-acetylglucosamine deacetylase